MKIMYLAPGEDLTDAIVVRDSVFVKEQGYTVEDEYDAMDSKGYHVVLYKDAHPIATSRFYPEEEGSPRYRFGRIAVLKKYRGLGIGAVLMEAMEKKAVQLGGTHFGLNAQVQAIGFYEKMGFKITGVQQMDGEIPHKEMEKSL